MLSYSIVIATRNRHDALRLSLPLHLAEARRPERIVIIDSSDDPGPTADLAARLGAQSNVPIEHRGSPAGSSLQRNAGMAGVTSDVVFFPDDDSLVHPGAIDAILEVYDRDTEGRVGGVCAAEAKAPPPGVLDAVPEPEDDAAEDAPAYQMTAADRIKARIATQRYAIEERVVRDPFKLVAEHLYGRLPALPAWLGEIDAVPVPWMTGFRMSFRTPLIREASFNTRLGRYALFEDIEAGFRVLRTHALVGAQAARIYHHKAPQQRASGRELGVLHVLNRAYVVCRSGAADEAVWRATLRYSGFKIAQYGIAAKGTFGRQRLAGAVAAYRVLDALRQAGPDALDDRYLELRDQCFGVPA